MDTLADTCAAATERPDSDLHISTKRCARCHVYKAVQNAIVFDRSVIVDDGSAPNNGCRLHHRTGKNDASAMQETAGANIRNRMDKIDAAT
jgi:hypothetical protein